MSAHQQWKDMVYKLVEEYFPEPAASAGIRSSDPQVFKKEYDEEYRGANMGMRLHETTVSFSKLRLLEAPNFDIYLYAWGPIPALAKSQSTALLITTEGIILRQDTPKLFGSDDLAAAAMSYRELTPNRMSISGDKLTLKANTLGFLQEQTIKFPLAQKVYDFAMAANKLLQQNEDLYDDAMDEMSGEE